MTVTRFAPSPTGFLHIGGLRTALFSWLLARKSNGRFLLRIEDTDLSRNSEDATRAILQAFEWIGMDYDGEVLYQSRRFDIYKQYINKLLDEGKAYRCYMTKEELDGLREEQIAQKIRPHYDRRYRDFQGIPPKGVDPVIRIKAPLEGNISFQDGVKGEINIAASEVDDFIIARSDGTPTYNFVVAIDDALMEITDVIRGDDHLYNTPKQIVIYRALGFDLPRFYHVAMINNEQGKKLSKRDGATDVMDYKTQGFLPEALLNFLVRLGWSHGDQEIFSIKQMIELFDPKDINKSASSYNLDKLLWLNSHYIKESSDERLVILLKEFDIDLQNDTKSRLIFQATKERAKTLVELAHQIRLLLNVPASYDEKAMKKACKKDTLFILGDFIDALKEQNPQNKEAFHDLLQDFVSFKEIGFGKIAQPLRLALMGELSGAGLDEIMEILGVDGVMQRVETFISSIA